MITRAKASPIMIKAIGGYNGGMPVRRAEIRGEVRPTTKEALTGNRYPARIIGKNIGRKELPRPTKWKAIGRARAKAINNPPRRISDGDFKV